MSTLDTNSSNYGAEAKPAPKTKPEPTREQPASGVVAAAADVVQRAKEETTSIAHDVRDVAVESFDSARRYAREVTEEAGEWTHELASQTKHFAKDFGARNVRFARAHALPLMLLGTSIGWLTWSIRQNARRSSPRVEVTPRRQMIARPATRDEVLPARSPSTATSPVQPTNKLMGVRVSESGYPNSRDSR